MILIISLIYRSQVPEYQTNDANIGGHVPGTSRCHLLLNQQPFWVSTSELLEMISAQFSYPNQKRGSFRKKCPYENKKNYTKLMDSGGSRPFEVMDNFEFPFFLNHHATIIYHQYQSTLPKAF